MVYILVEEAITSVISATKGTTNITREWIIINVTKENNMKKKFKPALLKLQLQLISDHFNLLRQDQLVTT